jgi:hypothetical protein
MVRDFRALVAKQPARLEELKSTSRNTYMDIQKFAEGYDKYEATLSKESVLEPIRLRGAEMSEALQNILDSQREYARIVNVKNVRDSLRGAAGSLGKLEIWKTRAGDMTEVHRILAGDVTTMHPLRQMVGEPLRMGRVERGRR